MKKVDWWIVGIVAVLAVLFFFGGGMMLGNRGYGMMGGYGGHGMMGNWGTSPFGWFGMGLRMIFMWIIPIGIVALIVFGVVALVQQTGNPPQLATQNSCPNCGKGVQNDWQNCPYCGNALK
ncbi:MAG: zinc ribbon domain-containing protein [Anaerolineales bacterium]|nr:MAG: zinc ribbon domain-containing protein [Anaerolineales bacterium]